jgi:phosphonate transport system substrate-binding protein
MFEAFCEIVSEGAGIAIVPRVFADYHSLMQAVVDGEAEAAWLPPVLALRAAIEGTATPLAHPSRGASNAYSSALFSGAQSGIANPADLRGVRVAWVDPASASGYLIMRAWLLSQRIDPAVAFREEQFVGTHDGVVECVLRGDADVGATYAHVDPHTHVVFAAAWGRSPMQVIALAGPIPSDVIAASTRLPEHLLARLQSSLVHNEDRRFAYTCKALFDAQGFAPANPAHSAPLRELLRHLDKATIGWRSVPPPDVATDGED